MNTEKSKQKTVSSILKSKNLKQKISMITCYDASFAKIICDTNIDIILVGDSLGNVIMGHQTTIPVLMENMIYHTSCVARGISQKSNRPLLISDMPFLSYKISPEKALESAGKLLQQGHSNGVKLEGGLEICPQIKKIVKSGIPVMGHLGFTPQSVNILGSGKVQGRDQEQSEKMIEDACALEQAGVFCIVLELVPLKTAQKITDILSIPTIGIGAGPHCDGQVLVLHDLLGFDDNFNPKFLKKYVNLNNIIKEALNNYDNDVKEGKFPDKDQSFS